MTIHDDLAQASTAQTRPVLSWFLPLLAIMAALSAPAATGQIFVESVSRSTPGGTVTGQFAVVDLTDPRVSIKVTDPPPQGSPGDAVLLRTDTWRTQVGARLAINANYYGVIAGNDADIIGLAISNGTLVSPARQNTGSPLPDPALVFNAAGLATVDFIAPGTESNWLNGVAGVGPSSTEPGVAGQLLVVDGVNNGINARVSPATREARTAVGTDRTGTRLYICVVNKRGSSPGMLLSELGAFLVEKGVWRAVNLDGGGSSSFVYQPDSGGVITNSPADGSFRAVANHLGVMVEPTLVTDLTRRPIRGAYLRPPAAGTLLPATFEQWVAVLAGIGITDLYLETLYWGRDTGANGMAEFPQRFEFDYLRAAILVCNKYNMRVHAWCETGYLDFGTTPSALLTANPTWIQRHVSVARNNAINPDPCTGSSLNSLTGDLADQRFVNLGNPAVRSVLATYFTRLAQRYPALEGIQADYHFFSLGNPPNNLNSVAPWSYDDWAIANFRDANGVLTNPLNSVTTCSGSTYHPNWPAWNRNNITEALNILRAAVDAVSTSPLFNAVSFGSWNDPIHFSKMIDLPGWGGRSGSDSYMIMAYGFSTSSINTELLNAQNALPTRRVIAALANLPSTSPVRPALDVQLDTMAGRGIHDFAWFRANEFIDGQNANAATHRTLVRNWLDTDPLAKQLQGDVTRTGTSNGFDGYIDARDLAWFDSVYSGTPIARTAANDRCDLDRNGIIDDADKALLMDCWKRFTFGDDGVVDLRDFTALVDAFAPFPANPNPAILHRWDLDGDRDVDYDDQVILHGCLTVSLPPDYDVNRDGRIDMEDVYRQLIGPIDIVRDGEYNADDLNALLVFLRSNERLNMAPDRVP